MSLMNEANEVRKYFKINVPKSIPDHVKLVLEKAFRVNDYYSFNEAIPGNSNWDVFSRLFELWRDYSLSKNFDIANNYGSQLHVICRVFLLALIRAVGYSYSEL